MVFTSKLFFSLCKGPDEFWRKRKVFQMVAHLKRRRRNCYSSAIKGFHRSLKFATRGRKLKRTQLKELWNQRLDAACSQHNIDPLVLREGLTRSDILLDRKTLVTLAIWEPRSFQSIATIACARAKADGLRRIKDLAFPTAVLARGLYK
ncbi:39S ribosomal protein L20, mitochondrial [Chelonus insularis]|uniref:39S ribosomal protein L20, mitochondrial n=1 Tax=Chelonus insularis TaxID=460826 RepID=UPI00158B1AFE|nr:39S ribosomal protein L20, mitochondrial [Chelonus insularis]